MKPIRTENLGALGGEAGMSGERSETNWPKGMKGTRVSMLALSAILVA